MANEAISYQDFRKRALKLHRWATNSILAAAWEDCAWCSNLTDRHILRALAAARQAAQQRESLNA
jgi:hypothetical protein